MDGPRRVITVTVALVLLTAACGSGDGVEQTASDGEPTVVTAAVTTATGSAGDTVPPLVDTGQVSHYDTEDEIDEPVDGEPFSGQDAAFDGARFSFTDNGDGTVTDDVTGLRWEQDPTDSGTVWAEAVEYCEALSLGGSDDWRIPSLTELFSISDFSTGWPYIDTEYFELVDAATDKDQQYWSINYYEVDTDLAAEAQAFGVNHATGHIKAYPDGSAPTDADPPADPGGPEGVASTDEAADDAEERPPPPGDGGPGGGTADASPASKYVRCVSGDAYGVSDLVDNGDGTVTDTATGLMWTQDDSGEGMDWASALAWAVEANADDHLGYDDWRLPNVKELQSIVDYSGVYPAIDTELFEISDPDAYFWSSTSAYFSPETPGYYYAWYVAFGYAVDADGNDSHGAGAVRFDTKEEGGPAGEEPERIFNLARLVRDA